VSVSIEIVRRHFSALVEYDWPTLESSVSRDADLRLQGVVNFKWTPTALYRHVTQAWDLPVRDVQLTDNGQGVVGARLHLTNDLQAKVVEGEYRIGMGRICAIILSDGAGVHTREL
jgi:hypothetical protein